MYVGYSSCYVHGYTDTGYNCSYEITVESRIATQEKLVKKATVAVSCGCNFNDDSQRLVKT